MKTIIILGLSHFEFKLQESCLISNEDDGVRQTFFGDFNCALIENRDIGLDWWTEQLDLHSAK